MNKKRPQVFISMFDKPTVKLNKLQLIITTNVILGQLSLYHDVMKDHPIVILKDDFVERLSDLFIRNQMEIQLYKKNWQN